MSRRWLSRCLLLVVVLGSAVLAPASPTAAHTAFESSSPAEGEVVDEVVGEIVIRFTGAATPAGEGFTVLDPSGTLRQPTSVTTEDDKVFVLGFDPPLAGGAVGVRWMVQAQDSHPIEGAFSFTVTAPAPTAAPTTTSAPTTTAAPATTAAPGTTAAPATTATPSTTAAPATTVPPTTTEDSGAESAGQIASSVPPAGGDDASTISLEEFLATDSSTPGEGRQLVGRVGSLLGVVGGLGALAFLGFTLTGTRREIDGLLAVAAGLGVLTAVAAAIEYSGWLAQSDGSLLGEWTSTPGAAMALRILGGVVVAGAIGVLLRSGRREAPSTPPARPLSAAVVEVEPAATVGRASERWEPRRAPLVLVGAALLVASFWFDGHTVSKGPHVVHAAVNSVHVGAAAVWAGGVLALLGVLTARARRGEPGRAAELIVRFSSVATVALVAVLVAGAVMAVIVLDAPGELTSTEWGRVLLLKSAAVGLAAVGGAYNHFRLRPRLEAAPDDARLEAEFRSTLVAESIVLVFVVVVTAWLVAAAT